MNLRFTAVVALVLAATAPDALCFEENVAESYARASEEYGRALAERRYKDAARAAETQLEMDPSDATAFLRAVFVAEQAGDCARGESLRSDYLPDVADGRTEDQKQRALAITVLTKLERECVSKSDGAETFEINLWSPKDVELTPIDPYGLVYLDRSGNHHSDHPCGTVMKAEVEQMPPPGSESFNPLSESVFELNERMERIRAWSMPVDSWVMGVKGNSIIVSYWAPRTVEAIGEQPYEKRALAIDIRGNMKLMEEIESQEKKVFECEAATRKHFGETMYAACRVFEDIDTGRERTILYQFPCT